MALMLPRVAMLTSLSPMRSQCSLDTTRWHPARKLATPFGLPPTLMRGSPFRCAKGREHEDMMPNSPRRRATTKQISRHFSCLKQENIENPVKQIGGPLWKS
jgi:hypothetical protein